MDAEPARLIIEVLKEEKIDLFVTLPEEPTASLTQAVQADPYFQCVPVASEDGGVALTAGAAIAGRRAVFVTGIAGLLKGGLALTHMGPQYGIPVFILASYRGDWR
jgi:sulfopyruvate decarboxylase TPP-binding subunit